MLAVGTTMGGSAWSPSQEVKAVSASSAEAIYKYDFFIVVETKFVRD
jgi:hypothetical protein